MKNKKLAGIIAAICVVLLVVIAAASQSGKLFGKTDSKNGTDSISSAESSDNGEDTADTGDGVSSDASDSGKAVLEDSTNSPADSNMPDGTGWKNSLPASDSGNNEISGGNAALEENAEDASISFPYTIPNTNLSIQNIASYDGVYLEDGSDSDVSGVAAIVLKNNGSSAVEYASITLNCDGDQLHFEASAIAAGATVVAQEANKTSYQSGTYTDCSADVAEISGLELSADQVKVEENEDGSLTVSNLTDKDIACVRVFYKFYLEEENAYVGGITYTAKLTDLPANGSQTVTPSHYSAGYSRVVMVRTYDTAD